MKYCKKRGEPEKLFESSWGKQKEVVMNLNLDEGNISFKRADDEHAIIAFSNVSGPVRVAVSFACKDGSVKIQTIDTKGASNKNVAIAHPAPAASPSSRPTSPSDSERSSRSVALDQNRQALLEESDQDSGMALFVASLKAVIVDEVVNQAELDHIERLRKELHIDDARFESALEGAGTTREGWDKISRKGKEAEYINAVKMATMSGQKRFLTAVECNYLMDMESNLGIKSKKMRDKLLRSEELNLDPDQFDEMEELGREVDNFLRQRDRSKGKDEDDSANVQVRDWPSCVICMSKECARIILKCGHLCLCEDCPPLVEGRTGKKSCPMCRKPVDKIVKVFTP